MKVPLVWDMCDAETQSVQIANPKHVSQVFKMSWKRNFGRGDWAALCRHIVAEKLLKTPIGMIKVLISN